MYYSVMKVIKQSTKAQRDNKNKRMGRSLLTFHSNEQEQNKNKNKNNN